MQMLLVGDVSLFIGYIAFQDWYRVQVEFIVAHEDI